jgi:hypothetical protein
LGERVLCKHEVSGSIPLSSTKTHSLFPDRRHFGDADLETGWADLSRSGPAGFFTASGRALDDNNDKVWMFDNEIDWVKRV